MISLSTTHTCILRHPRCVFALMALRELFADIFSFVQAVPESILAENALLLARLSAATGRTNSACLRHRHGRKLTLLKTE